MSKEQWELYKEFCQFAKLQDNSDAEKPNCVAGLGLYLEGTEIDGWDPLDDFSVFTPEFLTYVLFRAKDFWEGKINGQREKRIGEACFFDGILAAAYENLQSTERLIEKHWKGVDITDLKEAMTSLDLFQARVRGEADKWGRYYCCTHCGHTDWEEFEKPHGAPYYRCKHCGAEFTAMEVEKCAGQTKGD